MRIPHKLSRLIGIYCFEWISLALKEEFFVLVEAWLKIKLFQVQIIYLCLLLKTSIDEPFLGGNSDTIIHEILLIDRINSAKSEVICIELLEISQVVINDIL
jgi:hypothetical protein